MVMSTFTTKPPAQLRQDIARLEQELKSARGTLEAIERNCQHEWTEPQKDYREVAVEGVDFSNPIVHGVHIDYRSTFHKERKPYWFRTCRKCDKREETTQTRDQVTKVPAFR